MIADCKDAIIRQIVDKKVLKNHFSNKKLKNKYNGIEFVENSVYVDELKRYYFFKQKDFQGGAYGTAILSSFQMSEIVNPGWQRDGPRADFPGRSGGYYPGCAHEPGAA